MVESVNIWACDVCGETVKTGIDCIPPNWRQAKISIATKFDSDNEYTAFGKEEIFDICPSCAKEISDVLTKCQRRKLDITVNGETVKEILK